MSVKLARLLMAALVIIGIEGHDQDNPPLLPGKSPELVLPHPHDCFRACLPLVPEPEYYDAIRKGMTGCHVPSTIVHLEQRNLALVKGQQRIRFTAYMKDESPAPGNEVPYWCIVSYDSAIDTDIAKNFNIDCNYECKPN